MAGFSKDVRLETAALTGGSTAHLTVAGHSYGGAVVGIAETYGLDADRVMHVESPGMGNDVTSTSDYRPVNPDVRRYSMTAPSDPIALVQGADVLGYGHGGDPDQMAGVTRLATGNYKVAPPLQAPARTAESSPITPTRGRTCFRSSPAALSRCGRPIR